MIAAAASTGRPVRVAIVDDALFIREGLRRLLAEETRVIVVGTAANGLELLARLEEWRPDVVTLDLHMPGLDGLGTLDRLMAARPLPVIILSTHSGAGAPLTVEALSRGAVDFIDKEAYSLVDFEALRTVLVEKILSVSGRGGAHPVTTATSAAPAVAAAPRPARFDLAVIGASTGGPRAIEAVLTALGPGLPVPVAVVQHMPPGFTRAYAERLTRALPFRVREAEAGATIASGEVVIAPGDRHLALALGADGWRVELHADAADAVHRPSVDVLFSSAGVVARDRVVAVLLTGMGRDGARGMLELSRAGAHTIAQDEASCVVYGMPRAAAEVGAAREILALDCIGPRLRGLLERN
ncbi:MAG TPA: chemotaxis-specific protein-glutamate methyltransferase CheB [Gemmatimonadales bacterium]|nr:chemotaxis-specific protein-glutamate methyltransferase CheB [Gemmatimonadales bacterium]